MRIVLAVDGSSFSRQARDLVAALPWPHHTEVTLVTAYQLSTVVVGDWGGGGSWFDDADQAMRQEAEKSLMSLAEPLTERGLAVRRRVHEGRPADVILAVSDEVDADLIVLGSRGHGAIASMLLGSVSAEVTTKARRSVLVARTVTVSRLLVATDGSPCSAAIAPSLGAWGVFKGLPAVALSVAPVDSPAFELMVALYTMGSEPQDRQRRELLELHAGYARSMAEALSGLGIPSQAEVRAGDAAREITVAAREEEADLVVTGSRCLQRLDRWLLGSVAHNVLVHAHSSVLIVRMPTQDGYGEATHGSPAQ
jgi:nucleotide-binding universal stress UspA family protein